MPAGHTRARIAAALHRIGQQPDIGRHLLRADGGSGAKQQGSDGRTEQGHGSVREVKRGLWRAQRAASHKSSRRPKKFTLVPRPRAGARDEGEEVFFFDVPSAYCI